MPSPLLLRFSLPFLIAALAGPTAIAVITATPCAAQAPVPAPIPKELPPSFLARLRDAEWDVADRGPLLAIVPTPFILSSTPLPRSRITLHAIGTAARMRLVAAGRVTALVPRMSSVINTRPGKANPFSDLSASETLTLLLASFTRTQWQQAGSAGGIGAGDLTDDQRALWNQMLPETTKVQRSVMKAGEKPNSWTYSDTTFVDVRPRAGGRLRLSKAVDFSFYKAGAKDTSWRDDPYMGRHKDGDVEYHLTVRSAAPGSPLANTAYGVQLITEESTRVKPGAVDFTAARLDVPVSLTGFPARPPAKAPAAPVRTAPGLEAAYLKAMEERAALPTVGDLLQRISTGTRLEFIADRRVRDLPVYLRGDSARAGDLLLALCESVGGTFRSVEPGGAKDTAPLYLLTHDVDGVGTQAARLAEWAEAAETLKRRLTDGASESAAKNDPLSVLAFAPDDEFALPPAQTKRLEESWRRERYGDTPDVAATDMTPALRQAVRDFADERSKEGILIDTERVKIGQELKAFLILPELNGAAIEARDLGEVIGHQYLQKVAFDPARKALSPGAAPLKTPAAPMPPLGFTAPVLKSQRRVLIARPATPAEAAAIVRAAAGRGFSGVWLETSLADPGAAAALLTAATKAGGARISVGGIARLLRGGGLPGEPDRNILSETGDEYRMRRSAAYTGEKQYLDSYRARLAGFTGWVVPGPKDAVRIRAAVSTVASVPNLSALLFRATGGPGWTGQKSGGDGLWTNAAQGYTPAMRRAFLRARGIDPIDIPDIEWGLSDVRWDLGYFKSSTGGGEYEVVDGTLVRRSGDVVPRTAWWEFRQRRNAELLAEVFQAARKANPSLPLYLEDRSSGYMRPNTDWIGSWDAPERLPNTSPFTVESETRSAARRTSKTLYAHWERYWNEAEAAKPDAPATFARQATTAALRTAPPAWDGLIIDLGGVSGASVPRLLTALPSAAPPTARRR